MDANKQDFSPATQVVDEQTEISPSVILNHANQLAGDGTLKEGILICKPFNQWIEESKIRPIPKMLLGELWYENELCILFSPTGLGKSILACQIGDSISRGMVFEGFKHLDPPKKQPVLYFEFELSDKQLENRYSREYKNHYKFDPEFKRVKIDNQNLQVPENKKYETYLIECIENLIVKANIKIIIIDNLTDIRGDVEKAKDAIPFMQTLNRLKEKHSLSILVLAHTPKRSSLNPLTLNDLSGSAALSQLCDSCFALGIHNSDHSARYIKQLKERSTDRTYGEDNVLIYQVEKPDNILKLSFMNYGKESDCLRVDSEDEKAQLEQAVLALVKSKKSYRDIAKEKNITLSKVQRILKKRKDNNEKEESDN